MRLRKVSPWTELGVLYLGSCAVIRGIKWLVDSGVWNENWLVLVALVFLYTPSLAERWTGYRVHSDILFPEPLGPALKRAVLFFAVVTAAIYVVFIPGYHLCQSRLYHWFTTSPLWQETLAGLLQMDLPVYGRFVPHRAITWGIAVTIGVQALYQMLCVGYAEEFFYRGYMQTRIDGLLGAARWRVLGASFGWGLPITALLFTVGHSLVFAQWWQPFILFPALVFGWMRARSGNILAGALFHAWANTVMMVLDHMYGIGQPLEETSAGDLWADLWSPIAGLLGWLGLGG